MDTDYSRRTFLVGCACATVGGAMGGAAADRGSGSTGGSARDRDEPPTRWNRQYDADGAASFTATVSATGGAGSVFAGSVPDTDGEDDRLASLVKVDPAGDVAWKRTYSKGETTVLNDALAVDDGYVLAGYRESDTGGPREGYVLAVDADGAVRWSETAEVNPESGDEFRAVEPRPDTDGYVCVGETTVFDAGWAVTFDDEGEIDWNETYNGGGTSRFNGIAAHPEGGYLAAGAAQKNTLDLLGWVARINAEGTRLWGRYRRQEADTTDRSYNSYNEFLDIEPEVDGFIAAGATALESDADERSGWLMSINTGGGQIWDEQYQEDTFTEWHSIVATEFRLYLAGETAADAEGTDRRGYASQVDIQGGTLWASTYTSQGSDNLRDLHLTEADGIVCAGATAPSPGDETTPWALKVGGEPLETPTPSPTATRTPPPTLTEVPTITALPSETPTDTPTESPTPSPTPTPTPNGTTPGGAGGDGSGETDGGISLTTVGAGLAVALLGAGGLIYTQFVRDDDPDDDPPPATQDPGTDGSTPDQGTDAGDGSGAAVGDTDEPAPTTPTAPTTSTTGDDSGTGPSASVGAEAAPAAAGGTDQSAGEPSGADASGDGDDWTWGGDTSDEQAPAEDSGAASAEASEQTADDAVWVGSYSTEGVSTDGQRPGVHPVDSEGPEPETTDAEPPDEESTETDAADEDATAEEPTGPATTEGRSREGRTDGGSADEPGEE
jgi:hypothetical protein